MSGDLICWPAYPFRPDPVQGVTQPFLDTHPRGVPFSLLNREGKRLWWHIPTAEQIESLRQAVPEADLRNPPWSEIYARLSHQGMLAADIQALDIRAVLALLVSPGSHERRSGEHERQGAEQPIGPASSPAAEPEVDWLGALAQVRGNDNHLREMATVFLGEVDGMLTRVGEAIRSDDGPELRCAAQALKDALGYFKAKKSYELASRLEAMGQDGDIAGGPEAYRVLERKVIQAIGEIKLSARLGRRE